MVRSREDALARAMATTRNTPGYCQLVTRGWFDAPSVGDVDHDDSSDAEDGWLSEPESARHYGDRNPPAGVPLTFRGGPNDNWHRCISRDDHGGVRSTDMYEGRYHAGVTGNATIQQIEQQMNLEYVGWSSTISGIPIPFKEEVVEKDLRTGFWNVYEHHDPRHVREIILAFKNEGDPDIIVLVEGRNLHGYLDNMGYEVLHLRNKTLKPGNVSGTGNVVVMVKHGVDIKAREALRMTVFWTGPKIGAPQDPRVYRSVRINKDGVVWKVGGFHFPFKKKARVESHKALRQWFKHTKDGRPTIALIDYNGLRESLKTRVADKVGAKVTRSNTPDFAVFKNCELVEQKHLGKNGSDHSLWFFRFTA